MSKWYLGWACGRRDQNGKTDVCSTSHTRTEGSTSGSERGQKLPHNLLLDAMRFRNTFESLKESVSIDERIFIKLVTRFLFFY